MIRALSLIVQNGLNVYAYVYVVCDTDAADFKRINSALLFQQRQWLEAQKEAAQTKAYGRTERTNEDPVRARLENRFIKRVNGNG